MKKNVIVTITAPSGAGKSYLARSLCKLHSQEFAQVVTCTTRMMRPGEEDGEDYNFLTYSEFKQYEDTSKFIEKAEFGGCKYGTLIGSVMRVLDAKHAVLIQTPDGVMKTAEWAKKNNQKHLSVFIITSEEERIKRLNDRTATALVNSDWVDYIKIVKSHSDRIREMILKERTWPSDGVWDVFVPGDNVIEAEARILQVINKTT